MGGSSSLNRPNGCGGVCVCGWVSVSAGVGSGVGVSVCMSAGRFRAGKDVRGVKSANTHPTPHPTPTPTPTSHPRPPPQERFQLLVFMKATQEEEVRNQVGV